VSPARGETKVLDFLSGGIFPDNPVFSNVIDFNHTPSVKDFDRDLFDVKDLVWSEKALFGHFVGDQKGFDSVCNLPLVGNKRLIVAISNKNFFFKPGYGNPKYEESINKTFQVYQEVANMGDQSQTEWTNAVIGLFTTGDAKLLINNINADSYQKRVFVFSRAELKILFGFLFDSIYLS